MAPTSRPQILAMTDARNGEGYICKSYRPINLNSLVWLKSFHSGELHMILSKSVER